LCGVSRGEVVRYDDDALLDLVQEIVSRPARFRSTRSPTASRSATRL